MSNENLTKSVSSMSKKRYKHWTNEEEAQLISMIRQKEKAISDLNDNDWSEMAREFSLGPQQIYWKVKRLIKEEEKSII